MSVLSGLVSLLTSVTFGVGMEDNSVLAMWIFEVYVNIM